MPVVFSAMVAAEARETARRTKVNVVIRLIMVLRAYNNGRSFHHEEKTPRETKISKPQKPPLALLRRPGWMGLIAFDDRLRIMGEQQIGGVGIYFLGDYIEGFFELQRPAGGVVRIRRH